ncbi:hypothetical protein D039_0689B, partial [Vibrio parahaemolyticus EKP-028]
IKTIKCRKFFHHNAYQEQL